MTETPQWGLGEQPQWGLQRVPTVVLICTGSSQILNMAFGTRSTPDTDRNIARSAYYSCTNKATVEHRLRLILFPDTAHKLQAREQWGWASILFLNLLCPDTSAHDTDKSMPVVTLHH